MKSTGRKKNILGIIVSVLCIVLVLATVFSLTSCKKKEKFVQQYQDGTTLISPYYKDSPNGRILPTSGTRHDIEVIEGGGTDAAELTGSWVDVYNTTHYVFDGDCRGILLTDVDNYTFMYSAQDGILAIDIDLDGGNDFEFSYTIKGDKLSMTRAGTTNVFTKE